MIYAFEDFEFDASRLELRRSGAVTKVEPVLLRVLAVLLRSAGRLVTKEELSAEIWAGRASADNVITLSMTRLRKALRHRRGTRELIVTVHGLGYRFVCPVVVREAQSPALGPKASPSAKPPFVGRAGLLAELRQFASEAWQGKGRACVLIGEPGIGKTHVAGALSDELAVSGTPVAWGYCRESGSTPPLNPWLQLVRRVFDAGPEHASEELLGPPAAELRALLHASELPFANERSMSLRSPHLHNVGVIVRVLLQVAEVSPWVFVLEDLHRADAASLEVLSLLVDEIERSRILVIATVRDPLAGRAVRSNTALPSILGHRNVERFVLHPLSEAEVSQYVGAMLGDPDGRLGRTVYEKSRGNPFFMAELARQLRREEIEDPEALQLPNAALDIVRQHVAALDADTRNLLTDAAVIGVQFELAVLRAITEQDPRALAQSLDDAIAARVLVTTPESRATFAFRHELFRAVLYDALPAPERRRRHLAIARAMEQRATTLHVPVAVSELADHFYAALPETDLEKTVRYCDEAAQEAYASYAHADVARHMKQALSALALMATAPLSMRVDLLFRLALYTRGSSPETFAQSIVEVVRLAREAGDAMILVRSARMYIVHPELHTLAGATEALEHALTIIPAEQPALRASVLALLATVPPRAFDAAQTHALLREAEALVHTAPDSEGVDIVLICKLYLEGATGHAAEGVVEELERLSVKRSARAPFLPLFLAKHRAMRGLARGDDATLSAALEAGLARGRLIRHPEMLWHFERFRICAVLNGPDCQEGTALLEALHARVETQSLLGVATFCAFDRVVVLTEFGVPLSVDDALRRALVYQPWDPPGLWALKVRTLASAGLVNEARASLAAVPAAKLRDLPADGQYLGTLGHLARAALILDAPEYAHAVDALLAPYGAYFTAHASCFSDGSVAQLRGMLAMAAGREEDARGLLTLGMQLSEHAGQALRATEARLALATSLRLSHCDDARRLAQEAHEASVRLGLSRATERALQLLSELSGGPA